MTRFPKTQRMETDVAAPIAVMENTRRGGTFSRKPAGIAFQIPVIPMRKTTASLYIVLLVYGIRTPTTMSLTPLSFHLYFLRVAGIDASLAERELVYVNEFGPEEGERVAAEWYGREGRIR